MNKIKKIILPLFGIMILFAAFTYAYASKLFYDDSTKWITKKTVVQKEEILFIKIIEISNNLPTSLAIIEDNAFEGTALITIKLPSTVHTIGNQAFANIPTLKNITIPNTTTDIGKNAFKGSNQVTITSAPKSYTRTWAKENGIPFIPITSYYAFNTPVKITGLSQSKSEQQRLLLNGERTENKTPNLTGRMTGEIKADKYEEITAFHIQGRSPPMC